MLPSVWHGEPQAESQQHVLRVATVGYLLEALPGLSRLEACDAEIGAFNAAVSHARQSGVPCSWDNCRFRVVYDHKARGLASNLDARSYVGNVGLHGRVSASEGCPPPELAPHDVALLPRNLVFPERWRDVVNTKLQRDAYISSARPKAMTDQFKCARCKQRECSYVELQTRSCDEPATLFIQCIPCGHRWRIG